MCRLAEHLPATATGRHIAHQVIRCSTSPVANYGEVQSAESRRDFIHRLRKNIKELRETRAWLTLMDRLQRCPEGLSPAVLRECDELVAIMVSSVRTALRDTQTGAYNVECPTCNAPRALDIERWTLDIRLGKLATAYSPTPSRAQYHRR